MTRPLLSATVYLVFEDSLAEMIDDPAISTETAIFPLFVQRIAKFFLPFSVTLMSFPPCVMSNEYCDVS